MVEEASLEFRTRKTDETSIYLLDEIKQNALISEKHKKTCKYINYVEHLFILASTIAGTVSISVFAVPVGIANRHKNFCNLDA